MFCVKCGNEVVEGATFCPSCGTKIPETANPSKSAPPKIVLEPSEVSPHREEKDSSKSFSGQGKSIGICLMLLSIIGDLLSMFLIGFDAFIPVTIGATVIFVIGFFLMLFGQ